MSAIEIHKPIAVIYNYHPWVMPRLSNIIIPYFLYTSKTSLLKIPQIWIVHEVTQNVVNTIPYKKKKFFGIILGEQSINTIFDYYIVPDPTIDTPRPNVFKTSRLVPDYDNKFPIPVIPTIGSFWFATWNKWFEKIVECVQKEYDEAIINFNIPFASFWDESWKNAKTISSNCREIITKNWITLNITHDFFEKSRMLDFLAQNSINMFLYTNPPWEQRWISSVIENALAVKRPICISNSSMFRHIRDINPSICIDDTSIKEIVKNWFYPLEEYYNMWSSKNLIKQYEKIIDWIL
jgi:hypothetical protein